MDTLDLNTLLNKAQKDAGLYYIGIFVKGIEIISKTSTRSANLSLHFGRLIERSLELNEIIPTFKEEFLFSEGRDFSLFVYYIDGEVSIGIIHIGKPNFSLLKITAVDLSKEIAKHIPYIKQLYQEKLGLQQNQTLDKTSKENEFIAHYPEDFQIPEDISEIESVITLQSKEYEKERDFTLREDTKGQPEVGTPSLEDILSYESKEDVQTPSFEEIIQSGIDGDITDNDNIENYEEIVEKINREFVREIGPFGLYIFKKKREQFFKDRSFNKFEILKFIQILSEEISIESKRQEFIERAKSFLLDI